MAINAKANKCEGGSRFPAQGACYQHVGPLILKDCNSEWRRLMEQCWAPTPIVRPSLNNRLVTHYMTHHTKGSHGHI
ncbi:hypothetical protein Hdeb2414_s0651g00929831 [Helianthus debilis subsp. tardiflorus]